MAARQGTREDARVFTTRKTWEFTFAAVSHSPGRWTSHWWPAEIWQLHCYHRKDFQWFLQKHTETFFVFPVLGASSFPTPFLQVFVYRKVGLRRAPKPLDGSLDQAVQCTHYGHITPAESVEEWPLYDLFFPQICEAVKCVMEVICPQLEDRSGVLFGMDFICDEHQPFLLEINQVPRLCYEDPLVQGWTQRMAVEFLHLVVLETEAMGKWLPLRKCT